MPTSNLPTPTLFDTGVGSLTWGVVGVVPASAQVDISGDGISGWTTEATVAWAAQPYVIMNVGHFYSVIGLDAGMVAVTQRSNAVDME